MIRNEAINWCEENKCDFINPVLPPPEDWMWCDNGSNELVLQCIFTVEENNPVISIEDLK